MKVVEYISQKSRDAIGNNFKMKKDQFGKKEFWQRTKNWISHLSIKLLEYKIDIYVSSERIYQIKLPNFEELTQLITARYVSEIPRTWTNAKFIKIPECKLARSNVSTRIYTHFTPKKKYSWRKRLLIN